MLTLPPILDHYDDNGALLQQQLGGREVPELVKTAADTSSAEKHAADFALVAETRQGLVYKFPIVDGGNTLMSAVYFEKTAGALPPAVRAAVAQGLASALEDFGFTVPEYVLAAMTVEKTAAVAEEIYARNTKYTEQDMVDEFAGIHPLRRPEAARLLKEASVTLPAALACYARDTLGTDVEAAILARTRYVVPEVADHMRDLVKVASSVSIEEMAAQLYEIDLEFGLTRYYDTSIPDPYRSLLGTELMKTASANVVVDGKSYTAEEIRELAQLNSDMIDASFGEFTSTQLLAAPLEVFGSLPVPHQQAIARIFNDGPPE